MSRLGRGDPFHRTASFLRGVWRPRLPEAGARTPCLVIAHRGAARVEAENTMVAFEKARDLGADAVEVDVSVTADGRFALWHDADPNDTVAFARELGAEGLAYIPRFPARGSPWRKRVRDLGSEELARHYGYVRRDSPASTASVVGIDWLDDLLKWAGRSGTAHVFLDVKLAEDQTESAASLVAQLRDAPPPGTTFHLLSPRGPIVRALADAIGPTPGRGAASALRTSVDLELPAPPLEELAALGAPDVSLGVAGRLWPGYRGEIGRMLRARDAGRFESVVAWTINAPDRLEALVAAGVDGVLTDEPALLRTLVDVAGREAGRGRGPLPRPPQRLPVSAARRARARGHTRRG